MKLLKTEVHGLGHPEIHVRVQSDSLFLQLRLADYNGTPRSGRGLMRCYSPPARPSEGS
jgi:hypothetical protein